VPVQAHIAGDVFVAHYRDLRARDPLADLAAVWEIRIDNIEDVSPALQRARRTNAGPSSVILIACCEWGATCAGTPTRV
jgi:hypothetical protein